MIKIAEHFINSLAVICLQMKWKRIFYHFRIIWFSDAGWHFRAVLNQIANRSCLVPPVSMS